MSNLCASQIGHIFDPHFIDTLLLFVINFYPKKPNEHYSPMNNSHTTHRAVLLLVCPKRAW